MIVFLQESYALLSSIGRRKAYKKRFNSYLVLEYVAGGELFDYLVSKGRLRPPEARSYFRQIIFGLQYCHSFNICHRDLKPENLLLDATKKIVKVADFGMAALQPSEKMLETSCGSPHYASPEIVSGKSYKGTASDIWSCGIILFALLCGRLPFDDANIQQLLAKVRVGKFDMPDHLEPLAKNLISKMLVVDPEQRIKMSDIVRHPWFTDNGVMSSRNPVTTSLDKLAGDRFDRNSLDPDILANLKTLWAEYSCDDIIDQLTRPGPNWQKTFYTLLVQHRENYSGDEDEDEEEEIIPVPAQQGSGKSNSLGLSLGITQPPTPALQQQQKTPEPQMASGRPQIASTNAARQAVDGGASRTAPPKTHVQTQSASQSRPKAAALADALVAHRPAPPSPARPQQLMSASPNPNTPTKKASPPRATRASLDAPRSPMGPRQSPRDQSPSPGGQRASMEQGQARGYSIDNPPPSPTRRPLPSPTPSPVKTMQVPAHGFGSPMHAQQSRIQAQAAASAPPPLDRRMTSPAASPARGRSGSVSTSPYRVSPAGQGEDAARQAPGTPTRTRVRSSSVAQDTTPKAPVPVRTNSRSGASSTSKRPSSALGHRGSTASEAGAPTINIPHVEDPTMQRFFKEIADELANIKATGERPDSLQLKLDRLRDMAAGTSSGSQPSTSSARPSHSRQASAKTTVSTRRAPDDPMAQFDDADEEDDTDVHSVRSGTASESSGYPYTPTSPMPQMLPSPGQKMERLDSDNKSRRPALLGGPTSPRPPSLFSNATSATGATGTTGSTLGRKRSLLLGRRKSIRKESSDYGSESGRASLAYERLQDAGAASMQDPVAAHAKRIATLTPTKLQQKNPGLGLELAGASAIAAPSSSIKSPSLHQAPPTPSTPGSATLAAGGNNSPKQSWFSGLFNWKPATFTLMSTENFSVTHAEVKRLLHYTGARVFVEDSEHMGILKCSLAEIRENGMSTSTKPVRFRVEFNILPMSSGGASPALNSGRASAMASPALSHISSPSYASSSSSSSSTGSRGNAMYATQVTLIQEKGALSSFKAVYYSLRKQWSLDLAGSGGSASVPSSPAPFNVGLGVGPVSMR